MPRLSRATPICTSITKDLGKRIGAAVSALDHSRLTDQRVHQARKELKKARSSLRLLRPGLQDAVYRLENAALRDAARPLSTVRDAKVLLDTLQALADGHGAPARALKLGGFKKTLKSRRLRSRRLILGTAAAAIAHSRHLLHQARRRIEDLKRHQGDDWSIVGKGLKRIYVLGRRALAEARDRQTPVAFHEWRKQAKHLRYALELLRPLRPALIGELAELTRRLSDYLGDEHDLTVLREAALADRKSFVDNTALCAFLALIDQRQIELREMALCLGSGLYEDRPKVFAKRFGRYRQEWCNKDLPARSTRRPAQAH